MNTFQATWEDEEASRQVELVVNYQLDQTRVEINGVTPTRVTFLCPTSKKPLRSVGVWTNGGRRLLAQPGALCGACWSKLVFLEKPWCPVMGTPFSHDMGEGFLSAEAIANPPPFARARAAVAYSGVAREMAQALKFSDRTDLAPWMARWMLRAGAELIADAEIIVPVPLHWRRFLGRRFNQSAELARALSNLSGVAFEPAAVKRVKGTAHQVGLGRREREDNVRGAFAVPPEADVLVRGRRVLLVDDVYTTGATAGAATRGSTPGVRE